MTSDSRANHLMTLLLVLALGCGAKLRAEVKAGEIAGGPYCGVYCVWTVLNMYGKEIPFEKLLEARYVGSYDGSTAEEVIRAAQDFGLHAVAMEQLTAGSLRATDRPIILHVRRPGPKTPYAHWVLFVGMEGDQARIVDPPNEVQTLSFAELLSLWDGTGIVVSDQPIDMAGIRLAAYTQQVVVLLLVIAVLMAGRWLLPDRRWVGWVAAGFLAVIAACCYHLFHEEGLFGNTVAVAQVKGRYFPPELPTVTTEEVAQMVGRPDVTFIDARFPIAYEHGHVPGAINLPVYSGLVDRSRVLAAIPPGNRVILYCESAGCGWGELVGCDLYHRGYRDTAIYRGGYREWYEHERRQKQRD